MSISAPNLSPSFLIAGLCALLALVSTGCGKGKTSAEHTGAMPPPGDTQAAMNLCNFQGGPEDAPVTVVAYYPGRHEDTLAVVKGLLESFPGKVRVEIVDWRTKEGRERRDNAGLTCAGIVINGKNAFDIDIDGKRNKVMFVRGLNSEWTKEQLYAVVKQALENSK